MHGFMVLNIQEMLVEAENYSSGVNGYSKDSNKAFHIYQHLLDSTEHVLAICKIANLYLNNEISDYYQLTYQGAPALSSIIEELQENYFIDNNIESREILHRLFRDNTETAKMYLKSAVEYGSVDACCTLGSIYLREIHANQKYETNIEQLQSFQKAKKYFMLAIEIDKNQFTAKTNLGRLYALSGDIDNAIKLYEESAANGCGLAMCYLGYIYYNGIKYFPENEKKFLEYHLKAAELNQPVAQYYIAFKYLNDYQDREDDEAKEKIIKSLAFFLNAAEQKYAPAQRMVGLLYYKGICLKQDLINAKKYFTKAAIQKDIEAQFFLANIYHYGEGTPINMDRAIHLYSKAAHQGHILSRYKLGEIYLEYSKKFKKFDAKILNDYNKSVRKFLVNDIKKLGFNDDFISDTFDQMKDNEQLTNYVAFMSTHYLELEKKWGLTKESKEQLRISNSENNILFNKHNKKKPKLCV